MAQVFWLLAPGFGLDLYVHLHKLCEEPAVPDSRTLTMEESAIKISGDM